ncbi:hypothetical protein [Paraburkholderia sp. BCC1886]|uniref:hypothetical protein n=1 Tax=Paraburkholderia sp. BCC1886 TaxID=2562670 RepID=UPI001181F936|nr:hypothetical protein [Paraburkholderia sp. BCC1886]
MWQSLMALFVIAGALGVARYGKHFLFAQRVIREADGNVLSSIPVAAPIPVSSVHAAAAGVDVAKIRNGV